MSTSLPHSSSLAANNALAVDTRSLNALKTAAGENSPQAARETAKQLESLFMRDLQELLAKYGEAELSAEDHWTGYAGCGSDVRMTVYIQGIYDESGNVVREYTEIDLHDFVSPTRPERKA